MKWAEFVAVLLWIAGVVYAKGFWSVFFAIIFPPWAYYIVVENALKALGWL
jgi:uncharacterized membrane protein YqaE (UPF0057 family)